MVGTGGRIDERPSHPRPTLPRADQRRAQRHQSLRGAPCVARGLSSSEGHDGKREVGDSVPGTRSDSEGDRRKKAERMTDGGGRGMKTQVYVLRDPRDGRARYVGQSISPQERLRHHGWFPRNNPPLATWLHELKSSGLSPTLELPQEGTEGDWIERLTPDLNRPLSGSPRGGGRAGAGRPPSTGSGYAAPVTFKVPPPDRDAGERIARSRNLSVGEFAKMLFLQAIAKEAVRGG